MDILSAALDESGITGEDNFDFDLGALIAPTQPVSQPISISQNGSQNGSSVFVNGKPTQIAYSRPTEPVFSQALKSLASQNDFASQQMSPMVQAKQVQMSPMVQAKQMSPMVQAKQVQMSPMVQAKQMSPMVQTKQVPGQQTQAAFHRSASSPAIIKLPSGIAQSPQIPQIVRQQSAQISSPGQAGQAGKTKIITVKRVGPNGNVTQSRSFTIDGNAATGLAGGAHKIIVRRANGSSSQVITTNPQLISTQGGAIKIPTSMLQSSPAQGVQLIQSNTGSQSNPGHIIVTTGANSNNFGHIIATTAANSNSFENQFKKFSNTYSINSGKVTIKESDSNSIGPQSIVRTQPHVIQINRPLPTTGVTSIVNKPVTQSIANSARLVPNQISSPNPNFHVIHRPFQTASNSSPVLKPSLSMPASLSNYSNITSVPSHVLNARNTNSPPTILPQRSLSGFVGGKMMLSNGHINDFTSFDAASLSAMQRSVQNMHVPVNVTAKVTNKDVQRMWSNQDFRLKSLTQNQVQVPSLVEEEEEGEEVEGLGQAETYSDYMPAKLKIGVKHPDTVVETGSMSSIEPPDVHYRLSIPESTIDYGELSAVQLESIVYASQRHEIILASGERAGFLIGDGAGVGKGRTIAGIIFENYLLGRKRALWLSVSNDLRVDAERDLRDVGATKIDVHPLNKFKYAKISGKENGSVKKGVVFATYSSLIGESHSSGKYKTRFKQLIKWCGKEYDGVIVFDECHKAKNLCPVGSSKPTKTGQTVLELQKRLPKARVVYASATGASEPKNMAYMTRLGLWGAGTPFTEFNDFIQAVEKRGVGAMELVAMDMKLRGMYIARQLSFKGVSFKIEEIPIDKEYVKLYNEAVNLWVDARELFQSAADLVDAEHRMRKSMWGQFWSAHQRFFKYLCISAKVPHCVRLARESIRDGKCVVIGLQSTGEARTLEQVEDLGGELNDFVSTAKGVLQTLVEKHFPAPDRRKFFDVFGLSGNNNNSTYNEDSNSSSSAFNGNKRKKEQQAQVSAIKRPKFGSDSEDASSDSEIDFGLSDDSSDDSEESGSDNDNFNPFGNGSDSDDDPWLKRKKKCKTKLKEKKKKEKKKKKKDKKKKEKNEDDEFDRALTAAGLLKKETPVNGSNGQDNNASGDAIEKAFAMKRELLDRIEILGNKLPPNTLDQLIDDLGGPDNVAEMTGRKGRIVCTDEGINYESRSENDVPLEILNLTEKQRFMDGEKNIAIISEAASSGISLQADRRVLNQKRRVHITLELPWSADRAIQQFGRTHRSNQVSAPEYMFLISELAGEQRFASTVSKRLESLGALTHGDRRATESRDLSRFNFDNKFGRSALESIMKTICGFENPLVPIPADYGLNFLKDAKQSLIGVGMVVENPPGSVPILEKDYNNISKFLNRLLGMEVKLQNALFKFFSQSMTSIILEAKKSGRWDLGILDLGSGGESVKKLETKVFVGNTLLNTAKTELCTVSVERGMSFPSALDIYKKYQGVEDGFYLSLQDRSIHRFAIVAAYQGSYNKKREKMYTVYRPNSGLQPRQETLEEIKKKYKKVLPDQAQRYWEQQYNESATICSHAYWRGSCKKVSLGLPCEIGLRTRTYYILSGSVLSVWNKVESVLASMPTGASTKMQIIRLRTDDNERIVGSLIPTNCVEALCNVLSKDCSKSYVEKHKEPPPKPREIQQASQQLESTTKMETTSHTTPQTASHETTHTTTHSTPTPATPVYSMPVFM